MKILPLPKAAQHETRHIQDIVALRHNTSGLIATAALDLADPAIDMPIRLALLQNALTAEIICILHYTNISVSAIGLRNSRLGLEFQAQANDERKHMEAMARRIRALGGMPCYDPPYSGIEVTQAVASAPKAADIMGNNLEVERLMVAHYRDLLQYFLGRDRETSVLLQFILQDEEDHIADLTDLLKVKDDRSIGSSALHC